MIKGTLLRKQKQKTKTKLNKKEKNQKEKKEDLMFNYLSSGKVGQKVTT